jgi:APA family basic amino acid/polyamine antiporter
MQEPDRRTDEGLLRAIGARALGTNIVNLTVGAGIFVLPGIVAARLGAAAFVAYLVCSVAVALVFLCFAEAGSRVTRSGGAYAYVEEAFGPFAGFVASTVFWFGWNVVSDAAIAVAMVETLAIAFPLLGQPLLRAAFLVALFAVLAAANVVGVRMGLRVVVFNTVAKLVPLLVVAIAGLAAISWRHLVPPELPSLGDIGGASLVLFFAFGGAESALSNSGEIEDPPRTIPRGLLLGLSAVLVLYVWLQTVAQGVLGPELATNVEAPLSATADVVLGGWGATLLLAATVISILGALSGDMLGAPRVVFASAKDGLLPRPLARVHPRFRTPHVAIVFFAAVACGLALSGTFEPLAVVASGSILLLYMGVSLAVIRLRLRGGEGAPGEFRVPGGVAIPVLSCAVVLWLLAQLTPAEASGLGLLVGASMLLFAARRAMGK